MRRDSLRISKPILVLATRTGSQFLKITLLAVLLSLSFVADADVIIEKEAGESFADQMALPAPSALPADSPQRRVLETYSKLPLHFVENPWHPAGEARFSTGHAGQHVHLAASRIAFDLMRNKVENRSDLQATEAGYRVHRNAKGEGPGIEPKTTIVSEHLSFALKFLDAAKTVEVRGAESRSAKFNFFIGNDRKHWMTDVPTFGAVVYRGLYKGIDLRVYGNAGELEYEFILQPGADLAAIMLGYEGVQSLEVNDEGELLIATGFGELREGKPYAYQLIDGKKVEVSAAFSLERTEDPAKPLLRTGGTGTCKESRAQAPVTGKDSKLLSYGFKVASYDPAHPLIIDPTLHYSTFLGGSGYDAGSAIAVDSSGNAYVTGTTQSWNFLGMRRGKARKTVDLQDAFVVKLSDDGRTLMYASYLGGTGMTSGAAIAVDGDGNAYVTGSTLSSDFPVVNAFQQKKRSAYDAFVTKLTASGNTLAYSTYLGGSGPDVGTGIAVDPVGRAHVTGWTYSRDFPRVRALQATPGGDADAFVAGLDPSGKSLTYSTYLGGARYDAASAIALDEEGGVYLAGSSYSRSFPLVRPIQESLRGLCDAFVAKLDTSTATLSYSTFLGGTALDAATGIAVGGDGSAYVTGYTFSTDFPVVAPFQSRAGGNGDAFITKLQPEGTGITYSTFLGGSGWDWASAIAVDYQGSAYVTGQTWSRDFPGMVPIKDVSQHILSPTVFATKFVPTGSALAYSGVFGGHFVDFSTSIAVDAEGSAYVTGATAASGFPAVNAYQDQLRGDWDAYVVKLVSSARIAVSPLSWDFGYVAPGERSQVKSLSISNIGTDELTMSEVAISGDASTAFTIRNDNCTERSLSSLQSCAVGIVFSPSSPSTNNAVLSIASDDPQTPLLRVGLSGDSIPLQITVVSPAEGLTSREAKQTIKGRLNKPGTLSANGQAVTVEPDLDFDYSIVLTEGLNTFDLKAVGQSGEQGELTIHLTLDTVPPSPAIIGQITVSESTDGHETISGTLGSVEGGSQVVVTNTWTGETVTGNADSDGRFTLRILALPGDRFTLIVRDRAGNESDRVSVAGPLAPAARNIPAGSFGDTYRDLIPRDATIGEYAPKRFSLITGSVADSGGTAMNGATVSVHDHPEYGTVRTDEQGRYIIPVEGGGTLTVVYLKQGLITAHRQVYVPWNDIAVVGNIHMIAHDPVSTMVTFDGNPMTVVTHHSTRVSDSFGARSTTVVFTGDNRAYSVDAAGKVAGELITITTHATEFATPESMPAKLPPNSAYTYCVELAVAGAERVKFDKPVIVWVENFLGFPVGEVVPIGYYDRDRGVWVPSDSGRVVRLLDTDANGVVDAIDVDGDGQPDDLSGNGSYADEAAGLNDPLKYPPGATFWRFAVTHFSPWDANWGFGPPDEAVFPNAAGQPDFDQQIQEVHDCQRSTGSFVEERSRIFHEDIPIPGTEMNLHYASNKVEGYNGRTLITIPVSGDLVPTSLKRIFAQVELAGRVFEVNLDPLPNLKAQISWDGKDVLGRPINGRTVAHVSVGFVYDGAYLRTDRFGYDGVGRITGDRARQEVILWRHSAFDIHYTPLMTIRQPGILADGWSLSLHHYLSPADPSTFYKGDGTKVGTSQRLISTVAGNGKSGFTGDGGPATQAKLYFPYGVAVDASANIYIPDPSNNRIRKVNTGGLITTVAGNGEPGFSGDDGPATQAKLYFPYGVAVDTSGNIFIADTYNNRIRKVDPGGTITTVAGNGQGGFSGDGGPAIWARLSSPYAVSVGTSGDIYIADSSNNRIRKTDTGGIITTVAGTGQVGFNGDGGPAIHAALRSPQSVAVDTRGNIYIADVYNQRIRKVDTSGIITTVAGNGQTAYSGDGGPATQAALNFPYGVAADPHGNIYIADGHNNRIRKVDTYGLIATVSGTGQRGFSGDGGPATLANLNFPYGVAVNPIGSIYIADSDNNRIREVNYPSVSTALANGDISLAEEGGIGYIMSSAGSHKKTIDLDTRQDLYSFDYDHDQRLASITDRFGGQTTISRNQTGVVTAISSPDGILTTLSVDANNRLTGITYADGSEYHFEYTTDGLLTAKIDPAGNRFKHLFDPTGRLQTATDEEGGRWSYARTTYQNGDIGTESITAEGNRTTYLDHTDSTGVYSSRIADATGAETLFSQAVDGLSVTKSLPCGMLLAFQYDIDPQHGYRFVKQMSEETPLGLKKLTLRTKGYQDSDADGIPDQITETVSVNGKVSSLLTDTLQAKNIRISPQGRTHTVAYDPSNLLTTNISIPGIYDYVITYDARGRITSVNTNTRETSFTYDGQGNLSSMTDPLHQTTTYSHDAIGRVTGIQRPDGDVLEFSYDRNGNLTVLTNPAGIHHAFGYNRVDLASAYTTPLSGSYHYSYDKDRRLKEVLFPSGKQIRNLYDKTRLIGIQTPEGNIDLTYLCSTKVGSLAKSEERITYDYDGPLVTSETWNGTVNQAIQYRYNDEFQVERLSYAGHFVDYTYDNDGLLSRVGGFSITRDAANGLPEDVRIYSPQSYVSVSPAMSQETGTRHKALAGAQAYAPWVVASSHGGQDAAAGNSMSDAPAPSGLVGTAEPGGTPHVGITIVILTGLTIEGAAFANGGTASTYTAMASYSDGSSKAVNAIFSLSPTSAATITTDGILRASEVTVNETVTVKASFTANSVTKTASMDVLIRAADSTVRPTGLTIAGAASVDAGTTSSYVATVSYEDGSSRAVNADFSLSPTTAATITTSGILTAGEGTINETVRVRASYTEQSVTVETAMDVVIMGRVIPIGLVIQGAASVNGGTTANYTATALYNDGSSGIVAATFSLSPTTAATISSGGTLTAELVLIDAMVMVNASYTEEGITRDASKAVAISAEGVLGLSRTFSGYGELDGETYTVAAAARYSWALVRNDGGRIIQKSETINGTTSIYAYTYDALGRLLAVESNGIAVEEYQYDHAGNRTHERNLLRSIRERTTSYSEEDHLITAGDSSYQFDVDGFLTSRSCGGEPTLFSYSSRGELLKITFPGGRTIAYLHDPLGRRIAKKVDDRITEKYLWQGMTRLLAVYDEHDSLKVRFQYAGSRMPLAMTKDGINYYLSYDQVGSLRIVTDTLGNIVKQLDYDSFGNILADSNPLFTVPFAFAGGLYDPDTGLIRFGHRDYDPDTGRWTAKDPILFNGEDPNLYGYVQNDPVNCVDPFGLFGDGFGYGDLFPGHGDFYGHNRFDFVKEDRGWTNPYLSPERHFRPLSDVETELNQAINKGNKDLFERLMHQGQDYFSHYAKQYRWNPELEFHWYGILIAGVGHLFSGKAPDQDYTAWGHANQWTKRWVTKWDLRLLTSRCIGN